MSTALARRPPAKPKCSWSAHPDLYARDGNTIRLAIHDGDLLTGSLDDPRFCQLGPSGLVHLVAAQAANHTRFAGADCMTTKRLGLIMNGVTGRMGLYRQHLLRSMPPSGTRAARPCRTAYRQARSRPRRPRCREGARPGHAASTWQRCTTVSTRRWPTRERRDLFRCRDDAGCARRG